MASSDIPNGQTTEELLEDDDYADEVHILTGDNHYRNGERLRSGTRLVPTKNELEAYGHKFRPVSFGDPNVPCPVCDSTEAGYPRHFLENLTDGALQLTAALSDRGDIDGNDDPEDIIDALSEDEE